MTSFSQLYSLHSLENVDYIVNYRYLLHNHHHLWHYTANQRMLPNTGGHRYVAHLKDTRHGCHIMLVLDHLHFCHFWRVLPLAVGTDLLLHGQVLLRLDPYQTQTYIIVINRIFLNGTQTVNKKLSYHRNSTSAVIVPFKVIQGHRNKSKLKAHMPFAIS